MVSAPAWDGTGCEFDSWQCRIYIPCSLSLRLLGFLQGSLGTYGSTQKLCWKKMFLDSCFNPQMPKVFRQPKTPKGGLMQPPLDFCLPVRIFLKIFLMGMFSGSRNLTVIMKKFYLHCMTLKIKVKHLFAWPFLSPVVNMIRSWSWCRF